MFTVTDTSLSTRFPIYTRANVGEVFPDPVAPATRSLLLFESELGWRDAYIRMGAFEANEFPDDEFCILGVAGGYCYLNASVMRVFGERAPGLSWKAIDEQFFGAQPGIPEYVEQPGDIRPDLTEQLEQTFGWVFSITDVDQLDRLNDHKARTIDLRASRPDFPSMSDLELWEYAEALSHFTAVIVSRAHLRHHVDDSASRGDSNRCDPLLAGLTSSCRSSPVSARSTRPNRATQCGSCHGSIQRAMNLHRGLNNSVSTLAAADPTNGGGRQLGHPPQHCPCGHRPHASRRRRSRPSSASAATSERAEAAATLLSMVEADPATHGQLAAAIAASGAWLPARERTKTNNIRLIQEIRCHCAH